MESSQVVSNNELVEPRDRLNIIKDKLKPFGAYAGKILFAALAFAGATTGSGLFLLHRAQDNAHEEILFARQNMDEEMLNAKKLACATGNQLIVNFNGVSVDPLKKEVEGIKNNTGSIAESLPKPSTTIPTLTQQETTTTTQTPQDPSPYNPAEASQQFTLPCPPNPGQ